MQSDMADKFGTYTWVTGILLIIVGITGIILPKLLAIGTALFLAAMMLTGGIFWLAHVVKYSPRNITDWFKPVLLIVIGGLMLFLPQISVAAVGLMLAIYLLLDAFGSFSLAQAVYPLTGWGWMIVNGCISLLLAVLLLVSWPESALWMVGLFIGVSLLFDGVGLLMIGNAYRQIDRFDD